MITTHTSPHIPEAIEKFRKVEQMVSKLSDSDMLGLLMDCMTHILDPEWAEESWDILIDRADAMLYIAAIYTRSGWAKDSMQDMLNKHNTGLTPIQIVK